jgi:colanic acid biosynthesis glycosyl transferase WcaI
VCAPAALLTARLSGAKAWLHLQDFEVDVAFRMCLLKGKLLQRLVMRLERGLLRRFDSVSSISRRMVELLRAKGVVPHRTRYFPNWVDISRFKPAVSLGKYRAQLGIPADAMVVLFSGSLGGKQGLMAIPAVAKLLADRKDIVFVICGDGIMKPKLEIATADLPNVRLLPLQPLERLGELLSMADVHLLPQNPNAADLVLPSKLSGMLASGRPVIATCRAETEIAAVVSSCGVVVPPQDPAALAAAVCDLADGSDTRLELGRRARAYAEAHFERDAVLTRFFEPIEGGAPSIANDAIA